MVATTCRPMKMDVTSSVAWLSLRSASPAARSSSLMGSPALARTEPYDSSRVSQGGAVPPSGATVQYSPGRSHVPLNCTVASVRRTSAVVLFVRRTNTSGST